MGATPSAGAGLGEIHSNLKDHAEGASSSVTVQRLTRSFLYGPLDLHNLVIGLHSSFTYKFDVCLGFSLGPHPPDGTLHEKACQQLRKQITEEPESEQSGSRIKETIIIRKALSKPFSDTRPSERLRPG